MNLRPKDYNLEPGAIKISDLRVLIGKNDPTILEIGANVGQTTEEFLRECPTRGFFALNPNRAQFGSSRIESEIPT